MLNIKVKGGTPGSGKSLCLSCKQASAVRGQNGEEVIFCGGPFAGQVSRGRVPFRVYECSSYHPVNMPWKYEMEEMAWIIQARKRGPTGFKPEDNEMVVSITPPKREDGTSEE